MSRLTPQRALKATTVLAAVVMAVAVSAPPATAARKVENGNIVLAGYDLFQSEGWTVRQVVPRSTDGSRVSTWADSPGEIIGSRSARYSADATKVAYVHDRAIIVRDAASGAVIQVLEEMGPQAGEGLDWSPDGTKLVVMDFGSIRMVDLATETQSTVFALSRHGDSLHDVSWSPDGKWITFATDGQIDGSIRSIHPDGTGLKRIIHQPGLTDGTYFRDPQWSPDSTRLAYLHCWYEVNAGLVHTELVTVDKNGENPVHVSEIAESLWSATGSLAAGHWFIDVAWSPDGKRIAALDYVQPSVGRVRAYVADGSNRAWVTPMERIDQFGTIDWGRKLP